MNDNKKVQSGVMRCFNADFQMFLEKIWQFAIIIVLFAFVWSSSNTMSPLNMVMMFAIVISMTMTLQRYVGFFSQMVGFGLSRKSFMLGGLMMKPVYMVFSIFICTLAAVITRTSMESGFYIIYFAAFISVLSASFGDLLGVLIQRFNRVGFVLYIVFYLIVMVGIGIIAGVMSVKGIGINELLGLKFIVIVPAVTIGASTAVYFTVRAMLKRVEVRC